MRRLSALALFLAAACAASAQPGLTVSPDTLSYPEAFEISLVNGTGDAIVIDSLAIRSPTVRAYAFVLDWVDVPPEGGDFCWFDGLPPWCFGINGRQPVAVTDAPLEAGATGRIRLAEFDGCVVCRGGEFVDTLEIYSGGRADPDTVFLDTAGYVDAEAGPEAAPLALSAMPNPTAGAVAVRLASAAPRGGEAVLLDALGREVARARLATGAREVRFASGGLSPGVYVVRVRLATGARGAVRVTVAG